MVDLIHRDLEMPARVDVLRPPTFANLRRHLGEHPHHYHLLHFDGHGSYRGEPAAANGGYQLQAAEGRLIFETAKATKGVGALHETLKMGPTKLSYFSNEERHHRTHRSGEIRYESLRDFLSLPDRFDRDIPGDIPEGILLSGQSEHPSERKQRAS